MKITNITNKSKEVKKLPKIYELISSRFAVDYRLAVSMWMNTLAKIDLSRPLGLGLVMSVPKKEKEFLLEEIFSKIIENDKLLKKLLKSAKYETYWFKDDIKK